MRKTTKGHGMAGAVLAAAVVVGIVLLLTLGLAAVYFGQGEDPQWAATGIVLLYILLGLAVAVGVIVALVQRWREIRGGEEDEARKY